MVNALENINTERRIEATAQAQMWNKWSGGHASTVDVDRRKFRERHKESRVRLELNTENVETNVETAAYDTTRLAPLCDLPAQTSQEIETKDPLNRCLRY